MKAKEYLQKAKKSKTIAISDSGERFQVQNKLKTRPVLDHLKRVLQGGFQGRATFVDTGIYSVGEIKDKYITEFELYYDDVLISRRVIPALFVGNTDSMEVEFHFFISRNPDGKILIN